MSARVGVRVGLSCTGTAVSLSCTHMMAAHLPGRNGA